jgi:adenine-specific DNA-methyltransferase
MSNSDSTPKDAMDLSLNTPAKPPKIHHGYGEQTAEDTGSGVVLTKPQVVNLILDLAGYTVDRDLTSLRLLDPSCGHGTFLAAAVERLIKSAHARGKKSQDLEGAIVGYGLDAAHVAKARRAVVKVLKTRGVAARQADKLADSWIKQEDFLRAEVVGPFDAVVGNPPYLRIEQLSQALQDEYRKLFTSLYDRADLYVAFIEKSLGLLGPEGVLSFICADRWILNKYGAPLRRALAEKFRVRTYIDLHNAEPFESEVIAYPSIFAISPGKTEQVFVGRLETASTEECEGAVKAIKDPEAKVPGVTMAVYSSWFEGDAPWVLGSPAHLEVLRSLEAKFAPIEEVGSTRIGIGVATGNDKVYIVGEDADVEPDRLVPIVMREHIVDGEIRDARRFVINTFVDDGGVIDLKDFPRLAKYLEGHAEDLKKRHVAQKNPGTWYRTIDRVYPSLVSVPKLLIPDIASANTIVFDEGRYHPHHNLYFVTSDIWDMELLGGLLSSKVALFFVWSYAVKMRGGYLRFQAQYLRRIRLPQPKEIPAKLATQIKNAFRKRNYAKLDELALTAYGLEALPEFEFVDTRI